MYVRRWRDPFAQASAQTIAPLAVVRFDWFYATEGRGENGIQKPPHQAQKGLTVVGEEETSDSGSPLPALISVFLFHAPAGRGVEQWDRDLDG
ncbi:hypothetical protein GCM10027294_21330 [Marinactinospora endophytica]